MADIELTEDDFALMRSLTASAAFTGAVALTLQELAVCPADEAPQDFFLKVLKRNLNRIDSPLVRSPLPANERLALRQLYRVLIGFYRDPNLPANLPPTSTRH